ncbi:MAG: AAA family ATPase, partial [Anaerolineae bacterium]|nr:AAA family ATPase [Anaerolineae bacterium]
MSFCGMCGTRLARACRACRFLNPPAYRFCGNCGVPLDPSEPSRRLLVNEIEPALPGAAEEVFPNEAVVQSPLEGERRVVTVVVADVTGSTNLLESLGNELWVETMNRVLVSLEAEIYRYGGTVDQFRGDGLVAFFGADVANEDDPERAILASLDMLNAIERYNRSLNTPNGGIKLRVGVNTGEVIVASIGGKNQHREDTAMGIAIAVAARLESAAEPGTVLASESTYQQASTTFNWEALGQITVKGISQPLEVYRPTSARMETERAVNIEVFGYTIPLVGREEELERLKKHVDLLRLGQGSLVLVTGETGIGKQALLGEVRQSIMRQQALLADAHGVDSPLEEPVTWLTSRCRSYNRSMPYSMWIELISNWVSLLNGQNPEEQSAALLEECKTLWGEAHEDYFPYLAELLRLPVNADLRCKLDFLSAESLRLQIQTVLISWLEKLSAHKPTIIALNDIENIDPSSIHLLHSCVPQVEKNPLLFFLVYRREPDSLVDEILGSFLNLIPGLSEEINLGPLSEEKIRQLVTYFIGEDALPEESQQLLMRNSEGNPLYVVEILRSMIDKEILIKNCDSGNWCLSRPVTSMDLQGNLTRLVQARIDRLGAEDRYVLQKAAVIGPIFWSGILQTVVGDAVLVKEPLTRLLAAQLVERRSR